LKSDDEINEEAYESIMQDKDDIIDIRDKYAKVLDAFKEEEDSPVLFILTQNIILGMETALMNIDNLVNVYLNEHVKPKTKKGVKRERIN
jgi:hypothetical protein